MNMRSFWLILLTIILVPFGTLALSQSGPHEPGSDGRIPQLHAALINTHVVNVRYGTILRDVVVVINDGKIVSIDKSDPPPAVVVMDLEGMYLLPGFFDAHWHGRTTEHMRRAVESGVTTMRAMGVGDYRDVRYRELVKDGYLAGPDILAAGLYVRPNFGEQALADERLNRYLNTSSRDLARAVRYPDPLRRSPIDE